MIEGLNNSSYQRTVGNTGWNNAWAKKFAAAGIDAGVIQKFNVLGGMGFDDAKLQQILDQQTKAIETGERKLREAMPLEYGKLRKVGYDKVPRAELANLGEQLAAGKISRQSLIEQADGLWMSTADGTKHMVLGDMLPYSLPGWGMAAMGLGLANGAMHGNVAEGTNPLSGRRIFGTKMDTVFTLGTAASAGVTLSTMHFARQLAKDGLKAVNKNPELAQMYLKQMGTKALPLKLALNPMSKQHQVLSGLGRVAELKRGISHIKSVAPNSIQATLGEALLRDIKTGVVQIEGKAPLKFMGLPVPVTFSKARGATMFTNRSHDLVHAKTISSGAQILKIDPRLRDTTLSAQMIAEYEKFATGKTRVAVDTAKKSIMEGVKNIKEFNPAKRVRSTLFVDAIKQLETPTKEGAALLKLPESKFMNALRKLRPGSVSDAVTAKAQSQAGTLGRLGVWSRLPGWGKAGVVAAAVGAVAIGGYMYLSKSAKEAPAVAKEKAVS